MASTFKFVGGRNVQITCTTGTELPPADAVTDAGLNLAGAESIQITLFADAGQTITGGGAVRLWIRDPNVGGWSRLSDLGDILNTVTGVRAVTLSGPSAGIGIPIIAAHGQLIALPQLVTVSGGNVNVMITVEGRRA